MKIGVISDTHGLLRPEAIEALAGVDHILHGGDIGKPEIIAKLGEIAPVTAIRGNVDKADWCLAYPETEVVEFEGTFCYMIHDVHDLDLDPVAAGFQVVISGHSHNPSVQWKSDVLYLNPGSAGRRRFSLPITLAYLWIESEGIRTEIAELIPPPA
ncbi:metallophosphoesterase family protein [Pontibacter sp. G13]|uniref:metallophosphoesterase family protein n=1 Tax=Pontibacter sp. G13 TaxID=3074898 RepID=UPI002889362C|nr:metallophosphoesterase family protein [Pontibacter sp. G13]WNJ19148.1 metallophosphoesterase family protein [Pontibacter sp. G13]